MDVLPSISGTIRFESHLMSRVWRAAHRLRLFTAVQVGSPPWDVCSVPRYEISVNLIPMKINKQGGWYHGLHRARSAVLMPREFIELDSEKAGLGTYEEIVEENSAARRGGDG